MFSGFPPETEQYFLDLRFHNHITWFHETHERYLRDVQQHFYEFIEDMLPALTEIDPQMEQRPYKVLARIRRDTRFTKDKTPYRDHLWIWFHRAGESREDSLGYWFEYGVSSLSWGLGSWGECKPMMELFRREIEAHPARVSGIISSCNLPQRHLVAFGDTWKRLEVPPGVPDHLRYWYTAKRIGIEQTRPDWEAVTSRRILQLVREDYQTLSPIYKLLIGMSDESQSDKQERKRT